MKSIFLTLTIFVILLPLASAKPSGVDCKITPLLPLSKSSDDYKTFESWAHTNGKLNKQTSSILSGELGDVYKVDLHSDRQITYVTPTSEGSGGYLAFYFFKRDGRNFDFDSSADPFEEGWTGFSCFTFQKLVKGRYPFYTCGNQTYISVEGDQNDTCPFYTWPATKKLTRSCALPVTYLTLERSKTDFDGHNYQGAIDILSDYFQSCEQSLSQNFKFRFFSDLSLNYQKLNQFSDCLNVINKAKKTSGFKDSSFKNSILHNESLCQSNVPHIDPIVFQSAKDGVSEELVASSVPNLPFFQVDARSKEWVAGGAEDKAIPGHFNFDLRQRFKENLSQPCYTKAVEKNRFVTIFGCRSHSISDRAGLWVDMQTNKSIFILNDTGNLPFKKACILLGSRTVTPSSIPEEFWKSFKQFIKFAKEDENANQCFASEDNGVVTLSYLNGQKL